MTNGLTFDDDLRMRRTATSAATAAVLKNPDMHTADYASGYRTLEQQTGQRFPHILLAMKYLPVVHDGDRHAELRRLASAHMQRIAPALVAVREQAVRHTRRAFAQTGETDLMEGLVALIIADFLQVQTGTGFDVSPSLVFDHQLSIRKRLDLEKAFAETFARIRARFPDEDADSHGIRIAFAILGNDATMGALGNSLARVLEGAKDAPVASLNWPDTLPATGVPFVLRRAASDTALAEQRCPRETVHVDLAGFLTDPDAPQPAGIFGLGAHACLGRGFMQLLWRDMVAEIRRSPARVTFVNCETVPQRIFDIPRSIKVKVS